MANYPVEQHKGDGIKCRCRVLVTERGEEIIHRAVDSYIVALGIMPNGYGAEQNGKDGTDEIECQRIDTERLKEPRPSAFLTLDINKVNQHRLDAHRHAAGDQDKR